MHKLLLILKLIDTISIRHIQKTEQSSYPISNRIPVESDISQLQFFSYPLNTNPVQSYPKYRTRSEKHVDPILWAIVQIQSYRKQPNHVRKIYFDLILWVNRLCPNPYPKKTRARRIRSKSLLSLIKPREWPLFWNPNPGKHSVIQDPWENR